MGGAHGGVFHSWSTLLCFEMAYRGLGFLILFPLLGRGLSRLPGLVGAAYLGQDNITLLFHSPAALLLLLGLLLLAGLYLLFELTALFLYAEKGWRREHVSLLGLLRDTTAGTASLLRPGRLPVLLLLPVMALSVFSLLSGYLRTVRVPEFIMEYIASDRGLLACFTAAVLLCHLVLFLYLFGFPSLLFSGRSFAASWRESLDLLRRRKLRTAGALGGQFLLYTPAVLAAAVAGVLLIAACVRLAYPEVTAARGQFQPYLQSFQEVGGIAPGFAGEPVPTLDDMLAAAKGRISLMVELKSTGRERNLVAETLACIKAHGMEVECVIASMDMELLRKAKALAPEMKTALISVLLLSEDYDLDDIDAYSVETTALAYGMVVQAHLQGKQVYGWTANSEETMNRLLRCGVDGLVTDNPLLARHCISLVGENYLRDELADLFFPLPTE